MNAIRSNLKQNNSMKKTLLIVAGILAPLALQAEPTEGKEKGPRGERKGPSAEIIAKFDTDGDGKLNEEERKAAGDARKAEGEKRRAEMLEKFDTDKDGKLSPEERKAAMLSRFDADGDGELNEAEKAEMKKAMQERRAQGGPRGEGRGRPGKGEGKGEGKGPKGPKGPKKEEEAGE